MAALRRSSRRILVCCLALISFLAFFYELIHVSGDRVSSGQSNMLSLRMKIPLVRNYMSLSNSTTKTKTATDIKMITHLTTPKPSQITTVMNLAMAKKLDTIYEQVNLRKGNTSLSIFPAYQIGHYVLLNPFICSDAPTIDIIIIVHTAPGNFEKRNRMRKTFANRTLYLPKQVRIAFLLGKPKIKELEYELKLEHVTYNDTIMGDFFDDYHNLTLKGVMGFRWVSEYCSNSKVVLKLDDDVVVDVYKLLSRYMTHMEGKQKSIFCNTWRKNMAIMRAGKWRVHYHFFRGMHAFPYFYCSGFTVLMTTDLMKPLYKAAKVTPFFWIDDLFLFGILPKVVGGVTYYDYQINRNISLNATRAMNCWSKQGLDCSIFATLVHGHLFDVYWRKIQKLHSKPVDWHVESVFEP